MGKRRSKSKGRKRRGKKTDAIDPTPPAPLPSFTDGLPSSDEESLNFEQAFPVLQPTPDNNMDEGGKKPQPPVPPLNDNDNATKPTPPVDKPPQLQDPQPPHPPPISPSSLQKQSPNVIASIPSPSLFDTSTDSH